MIEKHERQLVLDQLASSEARLLELVDGLSPRQWKFRERTERWSIAENIEHVILFEKFIGGVVARVLAETAEPEKKAKAAAKEPLVLGLAKARHIRFNAREAVRPVDTWPDPAAMLAELRRTRAATTQFVAETRADLRNHFFAHVAFGDLDCYQWLVVLGQHGARHAFQIEEIQADPAYPSG